MENEDVVGSAPTGDAPTTSEWSTIYWPIKVHLLLETWWYVGWNHGDVTLDISCSVQVVYLSICWSNFFVQICCFLLSTSHKRHFFSTFQCDYLRYQIWLSQVSNYFPCFNVIILGIKFLNTFQCDYLKYQIPQSKIIPLLLEHPQSAVTWASLILFDIPGNDITIYSLPPQYFAHNDALTS